MYLQKQDILPPLRVKAKATSAPLKVVLQWNWRGSRLKPCLSNRQLPSNTTHQIRAGVSSVVWQYFCRAVMPYLHSFKVHAAAALHVAHDCAGINETSAVSAESFLEVVKQVIICRRTRGRGSWHNPVVNAVLRIIHQVSSSPSSCSRGSKTKRGPRTCRFVQRRVATCLLRACLEHHWKSKLLVACMQIADEWTKQKLSLACIHRSHSTRWLTKQCCSGRPAWKHVHSCASYRAVVHHQSGGRFAKHTTRSTNFTQILRIKINEEIIYEKRQLLFRCVQQSRVNFCSFYFYHQTYTY